MTTGRHKAYYSGTQHHLQCGVCGAAKVRLRIPYDSTHSVDGVRWAKVSGEQIAMQPKPDDEDDQTTRRPGI